MIHLFLPFSLHGSSKTQFPMPWTAQIEILKKKKTSWAIVLGITDCTATVQKQWSAVVGAMAVTVLGATERILEIGEAV